MSKSFQILSIVSLLSVQNVFYRPKEKQAVADQKKAKFNQPEGVSARTENQLYISIFKSSITLQGDPAGSSKPPDDFKTKVPLWPGQASPCQAETELMF